MQFISATGFCTEGSALMSKYMWMSTSKELTTGYGIMTKNVVERLIKKDVDLRLLGLQNIGHQKEEWNLPIIDDIYGQDAVEFYSRLFKIDYLITVLDNWIPQYYYLPGMLKKLKVGHICHVTINSTPLSPMLDDRIKNADFWVAPSHYVEKTLIDSGYDPKKIFYIPHGVDRKIFKCLKDEEKAKHKEMIGYKDKFVWLAVATNTGFEKNWQAIFYAYKIFLIQNPGAREKTVLHCHTSPHYPGAGSYDLELLGKVYGIADNLRFVVGVALNAGTPPEEMTKLYNASDCYLSASFGESFSLPVLESMSCGVPCIVPNHTTGPQLVGEPKSGLLAENLKMKNGDVFGWTGPTISDKWMVDPVDMADKMTKIYKNEKLRKRCGKNAIKFAKGFDWENNIIPKWIDFFNHVENFVPSLDYKAKKLGI